MNNIPSAPVYRPRPVSPQILESINRHRQDQENINNVQKFAENAIRHHQESRGINNHQQSRGNFSYPQQNPNHNQPTRPFAAPHTAPFHAGELKFQPIPSASISSRPFISLAGSIDIPGLPSIGGSLTARFDPAISARPTDTGGLNITFAPSLLLEAGVNLGLKAPELFGTKVGFGVSGKLAQGFNFAGPEVSTNIHPNGGFDVNANIHPTFTSEQTIGVNVGVDGKAFGLGIEGSQSMMHETSQSIRFGGPGVQLAVSPRGRATVSPTFDKTISITNTYTASPSTGFEVSAELGQIGISGGASINPTLTAGHTVTFNTDPAKNTPPKHEFFVTPGVSLNGSLAARASLLPRQSPVNVTALVGVEPKVALSGPTLSYEV